MFYSLEPPPRNTPRAATTATICRAPRATWPACCSRRRGRRSRRNRRRALRFLLPQSPMLLSTQSAHFVIVAVVVRSRRRLLVVVLLVPHVVCLSPAPFPPWRVASRCSSNARPVSDATGGVTTIGVCSVARSRQTACNICLSVDLPVSLPHQKKNAPPRSSRRRASRSDCSTRASTRPR